jgi:hypothetical protein
MKESDFLLVIMCNDYVSDYYNTRQILYAK